MKPSQSALNVIIAVAVTLGVILGYQYLAAHLRWVGPRPPAPAPTPTPPPAPTPPAPKPFPSTTKPFPTTRLMRNSTPMADRDAEPHGFEHLCGWTPDHPDRPLVQASIPTLKQAGPDLTVDRGKNVLLYKVWSEVFSGYPVYPAQEIGDCESFGHGHAHDLLETIECYLGDLEVPAVGRTCTEAFYATGREAGGMLGYGDGCYGSAMLRAAQTMGVLRYADLPAGQQTYSGRRAKLWGRTGLPSELKAIAAGRKLQGAMLTSVDDMIAALQAGHPCTISTGLGFTMTRDSQGFCKPRGRWGHCMAVVAYRVDRPGFLILQSWGPDQPQGPTDLDQPTWSFWCDEDVMARIIAEGDSDTLSASPGFAPRSLPAALVAA